MSRASPCAAGRGSAAIRLTAVLLVGGDSSSRSRRRPRQGPIRGRRRSGGDRGRSPSTSSTETSRGPSTTPPAPRPRRSGRRQQPVPRRGRRPPGTTAQVEGLRTLTEAAADLGASARRAAGAVDEDLTRPAATRRRGSLCSARSSGSSTASRRTPPRSTSGRSTRLAGPLGDARDPTSGLRSIACRSGSTKPRTVPSAANGSSRGPLGTSSSLATTRRCAAVRGCPCPAGSSRSRTATSSSASSSPSPTGGPARSTRGSVPDEYAKTYGQFQRRAELAADRGVTELPDHRTDVRRHELAFTPFGPVDGVLVVDTVTLRDLLEVIGPVEVDGSRYTAENVEQRLLNENYLSFDRSDEERSVRHEEQGDGRHRDLRRAQVARRRRLARCPRAARTPRPDGTCSRTRRTTTSRRCSTRSARTGALHPRPHGHRAEHRRGQARLVHRSVGHHPRGAGDRRRPVERSASPSRCPTPSDRRHRGGGVVQGGLRGRRSTGRWWPSTCPRRRTTSGRSISRSARRGADGPMWMVGKRIFIEEGEAERASPSSSSCRRRAPWACSSCPRLGCGRWRSR